MKTLSSKDADIFINIHGIQEPTICKYFITLNNSEFTATAELFAEQGGCLNPPFDDPVQGRNAIAQYFEKEARGMRFYPESGEILFSDSIETQYKIQGKVETNQFTVNITWLIQLNAAKEIMLVDVKLLTPLNDLLNFNRG